MRLNKAFRLLLLPTFLTLLPLILPPPVWAICPVCTIAVAGGLGLSRYLGIDDSVSGIWLGGLILSSSLWFSNWLNQKNINFKFQKLSITAATYTLIFIPLWYAKVIGHPFNTLLGIDKLIFGSAVGILAFLLANFLDRKARAIRGRQFFNYQKVVFPVFTLLIISLVFFLVTGAKIGNGQ
jgi:hypothetical protein